MITRSEALELLQTACPGHLMQHALASEAVLRALAVHIGEDEELWGLTGLLHDLDYPQTQDDAGRHGLLGAEMLAGKLPEKALHAIQAHNSECTGVEPQSSFDMALRCGETVTGLVVTAALVRPDRMEGMAASSLKKKMKDKAFAASVSRERIRECAALGLELDAFLTLAIDALTPHAGELGLVKAG